MISLSVYGPFRQLQPVWVIDMLPVKYSRIRPAWSAALLVATAAGNSGGGDRRAVQRLAPVLCCWSRSLPTDPDW